MDFYWEAAAHDQAGTGKESRGYLLGKWDWDTYWETFHSVTGKSVAEVTAGWTILLNGQVCTSGYPWQETTLY